MTQAGQAAKVRGLLLSAAASMRKGDDIECIMTMRQVIGVFSPFPPAPDTPEMEMVAAAIRPMSSATERDQLLVLIGPARLPPSRALHSPVGIDR